MAHKLWYHGLAGLCREVHRKTKVDIATVPVGEFITEYLTADGWRNRIIGQFSVNGSVKLLGLHEVWCISLPYVSNAAIP